MTRPGAPLPILILLALISACRSTPAPQPQTAPPPGLAAEVWIIPDPKDALALALLDHAEANPPPEIHPAAAQRWHDSGLRILSLPLRDLPALRSALPPGGSIELRTFGQIPSWTPLFQGPELADSNIRLDSGVIALPSGRPRILVRAWIEPVIDGLNAPSGKLRVELVPQHMDPPPARNPIGLSLPQQISPVLQGQIFGRLLVTFVGEPGRAYVIVGEVPDVNWADLAPREEPQPTDLGRDAPANPTDDDPIADAPAGGDQSDKQRGLGNESSGEDGVQFPVSSASIIPTLGEALLGGSSYARGSSRMRAMLVLIPSGTPAFSLLAP